MTVLRRSLRGVGFHGPMLPCLHGDSDDLGVSELAPGDRRTLRPWVLVAYTLNTLLDDLTADAWVGQ